MSKIVKTEAIVLSKLNYSDSSKIAHFFTKDFGKISGILKGGRTKNSKIGMVVDPLNILEIIFYQKENRDIQTVSSAEILINHLNIRNDFEKIKYCYAIIELVNLTTLENEINLRLFNGIKKILGNINSEMELPQIQFLRFFVFLLHEIGFELQLSMCVECGKDINPIYLNAFNYEKGIICNECVQEHLISIKLNMELFDLLVCLKLGKQIPFCSDGLFKLTLKFLENYLRHHHAEYKGLQSLKLD